MVGCSCWHWLDCERNVGCSVRISTSMESRFLRLTAHQRLEPIHDNHWFLSLKQARLAVFVGKIVSWCSDRSLFLDFLSHEYWVRNRLFLFRNQVMAVSQRTTSWLWARWSDFGVQAMAVEVAVQAVCVEVVQEWHGVVCGFRWVVDFWDCVLPVRCGAEWRSDYSLIKVRRVQASKSGVKTTSWVELDLRDL